MINWIKWLVLGVFTLLSLAAIAVYISLRLSLPALDGNSATYHVVAPTELSRDSLGQAVINANDIFDAAYALGFAHAQDRFFQMDLQRRAASGNLSQWVGEIALDIDKKARFHQFEQRAKVVFENLPARQQDLLVRYAHGVNEGLSEFTLPPFEYLAAGVEIKQWQPTDSILVIYSMYLDLQGSQVEFDLAREALLNTFGEEVYNFITQPSNYQAALDASEIPLLEAAAPTYPAILRSSTDNMDTSSKSNTSQRSQVKEGMTPEISQSPTTINTAIARAQYNGTELPDIGSNNWAVTGAYTATGAGLLANDMHLGLRVPIIWYRAQLNYQESGSDVQVTGVSLPGLPGIVVGTNGHIAWGFTNSYGDYNDVIKIETVNDGSHYLTADGAKAFSFHKQLIAVKDQQPVEVTIKETIWGPIIGENHQGQLLAYRWVAHDPQAVNFTSKELELATSVKQAFNIASRSGIPAQNMMVGDKAGNIGWTIMGPLPIDLLLRIVRIPFVRFTFNTREYSII